VRVKLKECHHVKIDTHCFGFREDVADLRFELGVNSSAAEAELVLVVCCACSTPEAAKKRFPDEPAK
jgi:hypothetical protein